MMGTSYQRRTRRSRGKGQTLQDQIVTVDVGEGQAHFPMVLPTGPLLSEVAETTEQIKSSSTWQGI